MKKTATPRREADGRLQHRSARGVATMAHPGKIDIDGLIAESKDRFDSAEYERQLKEGIDG